MSNTMLHVNNVCFLGGTMLFTHDLTKIYPEFKHYVLYFNNVEDQKVLGNMIDDGIDMSCGQQLTEKIVKEINPCVIFLNNTPGERVEGEWPYSWLRNWSIIAIHHNPTWPLLHADLDVFNSETTKKKYENCIDRIERWKIIPPCIDTSRFLHLKKKENDNITIGKISNNNPKKFPEELKEIFKEIDGLYNNLSFLLMGGNQYYKNINLKNHHWFPEFGQLPVENFYKDIDVLIYKTDLEESWCRVVTEAMASGVIVIAEDKGGISEQITHGKNGFLCKSRKDFINNFDFVYCGNEIECKKIRNNAKESAKRFDIKRWRDETIDFVLRSAIGVC